MQTIIVVVLTMSGLTYIQRSTYADDRCYAASGTFRDPHQLASDLARTLMTIEGVPDIPLFRQNTAGFIHEMDPPCYLQRGW